MMCTHSELSPKDAGNALKSYFPLLETTLNLMSRLWSHRQGGYPRADGATKDKELRSLEDREQSHPPAGNSPQSYRLTEKQTTWFLVSFFTQPICTGATNKYCWIKNLMNYGNQHFWSMPIMSTFNIKMCIYVHTIYKLSITWQMHFSQFIFYDFLFQYWYQNVNLALTLITNISLCNIFHCFLCLETSKKNLSKITFFLPILSHCKYTISQSVRNSSIS